MNYKQNNFFKIYYVSLLFKCFAPSYKEIHLNSCILLHYTFFLYYSQPYFLLDFLYIFINNLSHSRNTQ